MRISDWSSDVCSSDLDTTERLRPPERGVDLLSGSACRKIHPLHAEPAEDAADQRFGGCVKRGGMDDDIAGLDQCKQGGGDRRHARREGEGVLRLFPKAQPVLQYLLIGAVEAGIDKAFRRSLPLAGDVLEETFACRRAFKDRKSTRLNSS